MHYTDAGNKPAPIGLVPMERMLENADGPRTGRLSESSSELPALRSVNVTRESENNNGL